MHLALLLLCFLVGWLVALRLNRRHGLWTGRVAWTAPQGPVSHWWLAGMAALLASIVVLRQLPFLLAPDAVLHADASSHAGIAQALARVGAPHGWIDAYNGGFPLGVNYQPLGWVLGAALIRLGVPTPTAIQALGLVPYVALPVLVIITGRAAGARPLAALAGALMVAWISPYNAWLGTHENYLALGVLSQALAVLLVALGARSVVGRVGAWQPPIWGALLAAAHPQITAAVLVVAGPALLLGGKSVRARLLTALAGAGLAGTALYGFGALSLRVPFGWIPSDAPWWIVGYLPDRLYRWVVEGKLFDFGRPPAVTSVWILATFVLAVLVRHRTPRVVLVTSLWALALPVLGRALLLVAFGERLLSFLQPQRALALVPLAMAAVVVVGSEELLARGDRLRGVGSMGGLGGRIGPAILGVVLGVVGYVALPIQAARLGELVAAEKRWLVGEDDCGRAIAAREWVQSLDRGRLSVASDEASRAQDECPAWLGVKLRSTVPLGLSFGAGGHVGVLAEAFSRVRSTDPGSAARAEALGIRYLLHRAEQRPEEAGAWRVRNEARSFELSERLGGTDLVGVGCVEEVWRGGFEALRRALIDDVDGDGRTIADPRVLTAVEQTSGPLVREPVARGACDATGATVSERRREPGAYEATVEAPAEVDVVIRATAFPTWVVRVDGVPQPVRVVAPGFSSVRVPAGQHEVEAVVSWPRFYGVGLIAAGALIAALAASRGRRVD